MKPGDSDNGERTDERAEEPEGGSGNGEAAPLLGQAELERAAADRSKAKAKATKSRPVMPTATEADRDRTDKPTPGTVRASLYVWIAAAVVGIFAGVFLMLNKQNLITDALSVPGTKLNREQAEQSVNTLLWMTRNTTAVSGQVAPLLDNATVKLPGPRLTHGQAEQGVTTLLWMFLIVNVIFAALSVLFSYKSQEGVRRSRLMLTIVCVIMVAFHFVLFPTAYGQISALLGVVAMLLLYGAPSARRFFAIEQKQP